MTSNATEKLGKEIPYTVTTDPEEMALWGALGDIQNAIRRLTPIENYPSDRRTASFHPSEVDHVLVILSNLDQHLQLVLKDTLNINSGTAAMEN